MMIGIVGIYLGKLFSESKNRPNYIIEESNIWWHEILFPTSRYSFSKQNFFTASFFVFYIQPELPFFWWCNANSWVEKIRHLVNRLELLPRFIFSSSRNQSHFIVWQPKCRDRISADLLFRWEPLETIWTMRMDCKTRFFFYSHCLFILI